MPRSARSLTAVAKSAGVGIGSKRGLVIASKHLRITSSIKAQRFASDFPQTSNLANRHRYEHPAISSGRRSYHKNLLANQSYNSGASLSDDLLLDEGSDDESDNDDDDRTDQPWKKLLELPARVAWRASDPHPPDPVVTAQTGVLNAGGATTKQLRRTYASIIASHKALAERRERERRRLINRTHYSRRAQERDDDAQPVFYGKMETLAYLRNRMNPNYAIAKRVLEETKSLLGYSLYSGSNNKKSIKSSSTGWRPKRVIDMGIGVGSASAAAMEVFGDDVEWVHGVDPSRCMRECAKEFLEEIMEQKEQSSNDNNGSQQRVNPPRLTLTGSISADTESRKNNSSTSTGFDMALMTYTATEFPGVASNLAAAAILWQKLSPNGVFIMIEPGTPDGFNSIRSVRSMLLDCCPPPDTMDGDSDTESDSDDDTIYDNRQAVDECHIIAPCTHNGKCPMERYQHDYFKQKNPKTQMDVTMNNSEFDFDDVDEDVDTWDDEDWDTSAKDSRGPGLTEETNFLSRRFCSFVQTMSTGSHLRKGEKFSYLVAQKRVPVASSADAEANTPASSFQNDRLRDLLTSVYYANELSSKTDGEGAEEKQRQQVQALFDEAQALEAKYLDSEEDDLGMEFLQGDDNRKSFARIIRAPLKKKGHVLIDYCAAPGRLMRTRVSKALDSTVAPGLYTAARKSRWGGLWPDVAAGDLNYFEAPANEESAKKS